MKTNARRPLLAALPLLLLPAGCAKAPGAATGTSTVQGTQVIVTMTVAGTINPNYYYYVLFNVNNSAGPTGTSPVPVVTVRDTGGNGFAAGAFTNYVEFNQTVPGGAGVGGTNVGYFGISSDLLTPSYIASSSPYLIQAQVSGSTLSFQIPLAQLATASVPADSITSLQINFVTTNLVTSNPSAPQTKVFDALGATNQLGGLNNPITIQTGTSGIYNNTSVGDEAAGDVTEYVNGQPVTATGANTPGVTTQDLDITDWSVQIR